MNAEISYRPSLITTTSKDNNNTSLMSKKWEEVNSGLVSGSKSIESLVTEQNIENIERNLGGRERTSREGSLTGIKEDIYGEEPETDEPATYRIGRTRHNSIVGIVNTFRKEKRGSSGGILDEKRGRRKSWQARFTHLPKEKFGKGDRKRKQGSGGGSGGDGITTGNDSCETSEGSAKISPPIYDRVKRKSWWNIFVPDDFSSK